MILVEKLLNLLTGEVNSPYVCYILNYNKESFRYYGFTTSSIFFDTFGCFLLNVINQINFYS